MPVYITEEALRKIKETVDCPFDPSPDPVKAQEIADRVFQDGKKFERETGKTAEIYFGEKNDRFGYFVREWQEPTSFTVTPKNNYD